MAKFILQIEDAGEEVHVNAAIDPPLTDDKVEFTTAELLGLYLREHMPAVLNAAVAWAKEPEPQLEPAKDSRQLKLILPNDDISGVPV